MQKGENNLVNLVKGISLKIFDSNLAWTYKKLVCKHMWHVVNIYSDFFLNIDGSN